MLPRTIAGGVDVCPHAAALADLNGECTDGVTFTEGEAAAVTTKTVENNSVTVSKITLNGTNLYMIDGVTGTGGEEGEEGGVPEFSLAFLLAFVIIAVGASYVIEGKSAWKKLVKP